MFEEKHHLMHGGCRQALYPLNALYSIRAPICSVHASFIEVDFFNRETLVRRSFRDMLARLNYQKCDACLC